MEPARKHTEYSNDEPIPATVIQPPYVAEKPPTALDKQENLKQAIETCEDESIPLFLSPKLNEMMEPAQKHTEHSNDEPIIQPPYVAAKPHIQSFFKHAFGAMTVLDGYAAGASVREIINQLRDHMTQANIIYFDEVSLSTNQKEQLKTHLAAITEGLSSLKPNHFEGKPRGDFTSIIRSILGGITVLFTWLGAPKDRNLVAEMTGRSFFFQRSVTPIESNTISQELSKLINVKEVLASAVENISEEPEGPKV